MKLPGIKRQFCHKYGKSRFTQNVPASCRLSRLKNQNPTPYNMEEIARAEGIKTTRCDEIVLCDVADATGIYCIENKDGKNKEKKSKGDMPTKGGERMIKKVHEQLQGGARFAQKCLAKNEEFLFLPVLVAEKKLSPRARGALLDKKYSVAIKQTKKQILLLAAGKELPPLSP